MTGLKQCNCTACVLARDDDARITATEVEHAKTNWVDHGPFGPPPAREETTHPPSQLVPTTYTVEEQARLTNWVGHGPFHPAPPEVVDRTITVLRNRGLLPRDPIEAQKRKERPLARGCLDYFPDALMEVAHVSFIGNEQHNPGEELHWAKEKSTDEADCILRHLKDRGTLDTDGLRHSAKVAWRALALLQREIDKERETA